MLITCEIDSLRDEGEAYALKLMKAGVEVTGMRKPGLRHGYFMEDIPETWQTYRFIINYIKQHILVGAGG